MTVQYDGSQMVFGFAGGPIRVGNTSDLYSAKIQTNGNIHAQGSSNDRTLYADGHGQHAGGGNGFIRHVV